MCGPPRHPCSDTGRLEADIGRLQGEVRRKAESYEITTLSNNVADLARAVREVSSVCSGLCSRIEACEERIGSIAHQRGAGRP